jgi:hypothetical protein
MSNVLLLSLSLYSSLSGAENTGIFIVFPSLKSGLKGPIKKRLCVLPYTQRRLN